MNVIAIVAALIWLVALYAFVRVAIAWVQLMALAPSGQKISAAFEIGFWNFPAAETRLGPAAAPLIARYRRGFGLFFLCFIPFFVLTILSIALDKIMPQP